MSRPERLLLLAFFAALLVVLARSEPAATAVGAVAGAVPAGLVSGRITRLSRRMDARLGTVEEVPRGVHPRRLAARAGLHLLVLGGLLLTTVLVPFVGDELFAASAGFTTAGAAVLTASRLRGR